MFLYVVVGKRAKNKKKRSEEVMVNDKRNALISVIQECDRTDFVEIIGERTSADVEPIEAADPVPLVTGTVDCSVRLDAVEEFPTLSQLMPSYFTESLRTDRVPFNAECSYTVLAAPPIEEAVNALDEIEQMDRLLTVDVVQLVEEWRLEKSVGAFLLNSSTGKSLAMRKMEASKIADDSLLKPKIARIPLSSMNENKNALNQPELRCGRKDLDVTECVNETIRKVGQVTGLSPCWSLQLDDDFILDSDDDNLAEGGNVEKLPCFEAQHPVSIENNTVEVNFHASPVTMNRSRFDLNNSRISLNINSTDLGCFTPSPKANHRSWFESTHSTLVTRDNQAASRADGHTPAAIVTPFNRNSTPSSNMIRGPFEVDAGTPVAKVNCTPMKMFGTPASNRSRSFLRVNSSTPVATANQAKVSESATASTVNRTPAENSFLDCFDDDIEDGLLAEIALPPPPQSPIPYSKANTSQLTFTQAMACLEESYNTSLPFNHTFKQSHNCSRDMKISVSQTTKPTVSDILVPHFDLGFDLDDDDFEDDDVVPPSPPSSMLSITRKLKMVTRSNHMINETEISLVHGSKSYAKESAEKTSEIAERDQTSFFSNDCKETKGSHISGRLSEEVEVGIKSGRASKEIEGLNLDCVNDFASLDVEVISDTQPFDISHAAVSSQFNTMETSRTGLSAPAGRTEIRSDSVSPCPSVKSASCLMSSVNGRRSYELDRESSPLSVTLKEKFQKQLECCKEFFCHIQNIMVWLSWPYCEHLIELVILSD